MNKCKSCGCETKNKSYCSRKCYSTSDELLSRLRSSGLGKFGQDNTNYGKKWSDEQKAAQSVLTKSKVDDQYRINAGSANRGKKFDRDMIERMHGHRDRSSYSRPHSEETKLKLGIQSKKRFEDKTYKGNLLEKARDTREKLGQIIPLDKKTDWEYYWITASWSKDFNYWVKDTTCLIEKNGIFNPLSNRTGVVRDHIVSRKIGFQNYIFPEILKHPENCQIITISDLSKKGHIPELNNNIDTLMTNIENYHGDYPEHDMCLSLVCRYKSGERWSR